MLIISYIYIVVAFFYFALIAAYIEGWNKILAFKTEKKSITTFVSILIAVRNEEKNIAQLLKCLTNQKFPTNNFEIIIINDHSEDDTAEIILEFSRKFENIKLIQLSGNNCGKKQALAEGIKQAKGQLIITTDADCTMNSNWLSTIVSYYEKFRPKMLISPVVYQPDKHFFEAIQALELLSLVGSGAGAAGINRATMCNGANLAFEKSVYFEFTDSLNEKIASGDDVFLMLNIKKKHPSRIQFLKSSDAIVQTCSQPNLSGFVQQRKRWTSKAKAYRDAELVFVSVLVYLTNLLIFIGFFIPALFKSFLVLFCVKAFIDFVFLMQITHFFKKFYLMKWFLPLQFLYPVYICIVGFWGLCGSFEWKNRKFTKS